MKTIKIPLKLTNLEGTIIDIETTQLDAEKGELITAGLLTSEGMTILQRLEATEANFKKAVAKELKAAKKPWYAFKKDMEEQFLSVKIENDLQLGTEASFGSLLRGGLLDHYNALCDPCFSDEIPQFWDAWNATKNLLFISKIVRHNCCCLAKEYYLKQKWQDKIGPKKIERLPCSAQLEKKQIRKQIGILNT
jgi:hypothetical protein